MLLTKLGPNPQAESVSIYAVFGAVIRLELSPSVVLCALAQRRSRWNSPSSTACGDNLHSQKRDNDGTPEAFEKGFCVVFANVSAVGRSVSDVSQ